MVGKRKRRTSLELLTGATTSDNNNNNNSDSDRGNKKDNKIKFECDLCGKALSNERNLIAHKERLHATPRDNTKKRRIEPIYTNLKENQALANISRHLPCFFAKYLVAKVTDYHIPDSYPILGK